MTLQRLIFSRIFSTLAVQTKGLGWRLLFCMYSSMASMSSFDAIEVAAADALFRQFAEPPLHQIQPRGAGGDEMEMEAGMLG